MNSGLSLAQIALLAGYAVGMAGGQLLFKTATLQLPGEAPLATRLVSLLQNGFFLGAVALYARCRCFGCGSDLHAAVARLSVRRDRLRAHAVARRARLRRTALVRLLIGLAVIVGGLYLVAG